MEVALGSTRDFAAWLLRPAFLLVVLSIPVAAHAEVVYLTTQNGAARFQRSASDPAALALFGFIETETHLTFCGPASLAAALNSLGIVDPTPAPLSPYHLVIQESVFTTETQAVKRYFEVERDGLTLDELARFAGNLHVSAEAIHALDVSPDQMRDRLRATLLEAGTRVLVNYSRKPLGQDGDGHISPVAAYDAQSDSFLILDVARYKYPPAWISFDQLFDAMREIDSTSKQSRGALIISRPTSISAR